VPPGVPVASPGWEFVDWAWDFSDPILNDTNIVANWRLLTFTVNFLNQDGSVFHTENVTHGSSVTVPVGEPVANAGWEFVDWAWDFSTPITGNTNIEALWIEPWEITFNLGGGNVSGDGSDVLVPVLHGDDVTPPTPIRDNHTFAGWFLADGVTATVAEDFQNITSDMTFIAQWTPYPVVSFDLNDGTLVSGVLVQSVAPGSDATPPTTIREGYSFAGWSPEGGYISVNSNRTITAQWSPIDGDNGDDSQIDNGDDNQIDNGGDDQNDNDPPGDGNNIPEYPQFGRRARRLAPTTQPPSQTTPAPDTPPAQPEIGSETPTVSELPFMFGYLDGTFRPNAQLTRAEFATIVHRLLDNTQNNSNAEFSDTQGHWASNAISFMADNGFMIGYPDGTFKPNQPITRAEVATVSANVKQLTNVTDNGLLRDINNHWARQFILAVVNANAIIGYPDGTFRPDNYITRAEVVIVINRLWNRSTDFRTDTIFPDVNSSFWAYSYIMNAANGS